LSAIDPTSFSAIDPAKVLSYGAVGLGFLLACLSYRLLSAEQSRPKPNTSMIRATYAFMFFCFLLTSSGFIAEWSKSQVQSGKQALLTQAPPEPTGFFVYGVVDDPDGKPLEGVSVKVVEILDNGTTKVLDSQMSNEAGSFAANFPISANSKIMIETKQSGYRGQKIILQRNAATLPTTLIRAVKQSHE
jgi:hypothetical protein